MVVGKDVITNPAFHVARDAEDHLGWAKGSAIQRHIKEFSHEADDFELLDAS